ncbi:MAG: HigA family addiction module antidote protein [Muribaculaceae bacterium]|nr:HigA family addiction module antidote protein [Muribaculaceae bacterium]
MIEIPGIDPNMIANNLVPSQPTHPGEVLRDEIESRGITQTKLANEIGVRVSLLNELINGKRNFTIEYAMMIEAALGIDADFWVRMQANYDRKMANLNKKFMDKISNIRRIAVVL